MKLIAENIANLFKVKTIISILAMTTFVKLAIDGTIQPDQVMYIITTIVAFYFGTVTEKNNKQGTGSTV